jgi:hypothetical protein
MSWTIFKLELASKMENPNWDSVEDYADFFVKKYDECVKRGFDIITKNTAIQGNTELMKSTLILALMQGTNSKSEDFYNQSLALYGKAIISYWVGVELGKIPPLIPAPGTILNLSVVSNTVINPGVWIEAPIPILPSTTINTFLEIIVLAAKIHLTTIGGICNTISQYPPTAPPGPGILTWQGYTIIE